MASIQLFGKTLEIPQRNEPLVKILRELLEEAEDGRLVAMSHVSRRSDGSWSVQSIEDGALNFATLGAIGMLQANYQTAMLMESVEDGEDDDD